MHTNININGKTADRLSRLGYQRPVRKVEKFHPKNECVISHRATEATIVVCGEVKGIERR